MSTHLLLNERPLQVLPTLAAIFGINEAIAIQQIHWVITIKHEHQDDKTFYKDFMWCKYTLVQWGEKMPWLSSSSIFRLFKKLESEGIIKTCQPYAPSRDQTKWYRIDYDVLKVKAQNPSSQNDDLPSSQNDDLPSSQNDYMINRSKDLKDLNKKKENLFPDQKTDPHSDLNKTQTEDLDKTPPIAPPAAPPFFDDPMGDRFRDGGNKPKQVKAWQENDLFVRFIHKDLAQKSEYYKNQPYESAKHYIGKSRLSSPDMVLRFEELTDHYQNFLKSQAQRSQQPAPQVAPIELIVTAPVPSNVREFAAKLARKSS